MPPPFVRCVIRCMICGARQGRTVIPAAQKIKRRGSTGRVGRCVFHRAAVWKLAERWRKRVAAGSGAPCQGVSFLSLRALSAGLCTQGEYLDLFFKDLLRAAGQEDAWLRASGDPWAALDCTPRTRYMFQASALRYEVASTLIKRLGLADIDDFK